jgi:gliding motility-associated-like protein
MFNYYTSIILLFAVSPIYAQIIYSNGATNVITFGGIVQCNGGIQLTNGSLLLNEGSLTVTKNSSLSQAGNFFNTSSSTISGNGLYSIEQDWINDATFLAQLSEMVLFGNTEQLITSTTGVITEFNNLTLISSGTGVNKRKTLSNVNSRTSASGILTINGCELYTGSNSFEVLNPDPSSVVNLTTFGSEGFVSSIDPGYFVRHTNQISSYLFPVGSNDETFRYRPVSISPNSISNNTFNVRLNNYSADTDDYFLAQHAADIETANHLFYHSIERFAGSSSADIRIHYLTNYDGDWASIAHWYPIKNEWEDVDNSSNGVSTNYTFNEKVSWDFPTTNPSYVLITNAVQLFIPNIFTPNFDGDNDNFFITSKGLTEYNLVIVNRWGIPVFESTNAQEAWDGTSGGEECLDGVYFYILKGKSTSKDYIKQGNITLTRN